MREDYMPNEKYRNMFGIERNGYGMERVDLYLAQLEVAFKKIREDNRNLKQELSARESAGMLSDGTAAAGAAPSMGTTPSMGTAGYPPPPEVMQRLAAQEQYIAQLQAQLAEQRRGCAELTEQSQRLAAQLQEAGAPAPRPDEQLLQQMGALRAEADELRRQLRRQVTGPMPQYPHAPRMEAPRMEMPMPDNRQDMIGKVLVGAQAQAEEIRRAAQMEADQAILLGKQSADQTIQAAKQAADQTVRAAKQHAEETIQAAGRQADALRAEKERIRAQLEEISYALRGVLRLSENDNRGEDFAEE